MGSRLRDGGVSDLKALDRESSRDVGGAKGLPHARVGGAACRTVGFVKFRDIMGWLEV